MKTGAVITADIVNSTVLEASGMKKLLRLLQAEMKKFQFEFYRGDSFQVYVDDPSRALELALRLRCLAISIHKAVDIRASIGIGLVSGAKSFRTSNSEAFIISGRAFDKLPGYSKLVIQSSNKNANISFRVIAYFCDHLITHLTPKQAATVGELLQGQTQTQAAKKLSITQATINRHAQAAGWMEFDRLLVEYSNTIDEFDLS